MKNVLVIGGTGFIGGHLVEQLIGKGNKVSVLARRSSDTSFVESLGAQVRFADLLDKDPLSEAVRGADTVFCAVNIKASGKSRQEYEREIFQVHVEGTRNLIGACVACGVRRIIYFSSVAAMGYKKGVSTYDESFQEGPIDAYGRAKLEAELILNEAARRGEADITILRPPGVFGERGLGAITKIILCVGKGFVPVIGSGRNRQSLSYVGNIVNQALCAAQDQNAVGKTYIVGDDRAYSVNELIRAVCAALHKGALRIHIPFFLVISLVYFINFLGFIFLRREFINKENIIAIATERVFDSSKIFKELGYRQEHDLADSITRTVSWYKKKDA